MIVTHLFQVLELVAMEPPTSFDARHLREETTKVFDAVKPIDIRHVVRTARGLLRRARRVPGLADRHPGRGAGRGRQLAVTFRYGGSFSVANTLQGYERLLRDAMLGDQSCSHVTSGTARRTCG